MTVFNFTGGVKPAHSKGFALFSKRKVSGSASSHVKFGFTLAEVLIILGVIGVVAALTIPTIIKKYQQTVTVNKLKKFYSEMNQALLISQSENGEYLTWGYKSGGAGDQLLFYNNYIKPYIKHTGNIQKNFDIVGDFNPGLKFEFLNGTQVVLATQGSGYMQNEGNPRNTAIIFYTSIGKVGGYPRDEVKNPTHERFYFYINDDGKLVPPSMHKARNENIASCKQSFAGGVYGNYGHVDCATIIIKDGWKISRDYPW